jgi:hypothetical protein
MARRRPQKPSDKEWDEDEKLFGRESNHRNISTPTDPTSEALPHNPLPLSEADFWGEDEKLFCEELRELAAKHGGIYQQALDKNP